MARRPRGFTLVELMITVVVVAILGAVALPSFLSQMRKGRRSDAVAALSLVQQAQEKWRSSNGSYTTDLSTAGLGLPSVSSAGYYAISVTSASVTGYVALAQAVSSSSQAGDTPCVKMAVQMDGGTVRYGSGSGAATTQLTDSNGCWAH